MLPLPRLPSPRIVLRVSLVSTLLAEAPRIQLVEPVSSITPLPVSVVDDPMYHEELFSPTKGTVPFKVIVPSRVPTSLTGVVNLPVPATCNVPPFNKPPLPI